MNTLDNETYSKMLEHSKKGDTLVEQGHAEDAINEYLRALNLLPDPVYKWEAATWLHTAIGDTYWMLKDYEQAYKAFQSALLGPDGLGNPFIHLRLGQIHCELGENNKARDELLRAYMGAGMDIFNGEDPKYYQAIEDLI